MFSSAIKLVVAQRLVRRLDDTTKEPYKPDEDEVNHIKSVLSTVPEGIDVPDLDNLTLYRPGSSAENPIGYQGRIIIMEQLELTPKIQAIIHDDAKRNQEAVAELAQEEGMLTILQDAILKVISGQTTLQEVYKVID